MSVLETYRKMTSREQTAYDLGFHEGHNAAIVHGRWIEHPDVDILDGKRISNYECSQCCCFYRTHENYCGFCGAKMDGGKEDV